MAVEEYCRQVEAYLCRKNDGHLIRIVGPAFEQVCGWAIQGVPLKVAFAGIDRYFERYYAKGPRRRPVRIEFCEADVLDAFDEWRRAVGLPVVDTRTAVATADRGDTSDMADEGAAIDDPVRRRGSLPAHLDRVIARLTALRAGGDRALDDVLDALVRELDNARAHAKSLRGDARVAFLDRLRVLDASLIDAARAHCDEATLQQLATEADEELAPFRSRMPQPAYDGARRAALERLIRERGRLPVIAFE